MPSLRILAGVRRAVAAPAFRCAFSTKAASIIALDSAAFTKLRFRENVYVDKTSAIADFLMADEGMHNQSYAFFTRPRKFGKSLTLDIMARMLSAGQLPQGVHQWPGYRSVDVDALFGGLAVHARWRARDPTLRELLRQPHFVVSLGLGDARTGAVLQASIVSGIATIAHQAFGAAVAAEVRAQPTPGRALEALISAVPPEVPVAVLVDEYDAAIIHDVSELRWADAQIGIEALRSLLMAVKSPAIAACINRCVVAGVASFAQTSLFSSANNFHNFTHDAITSRMLGFTSKEIESTFPDELARLGAGMSLDSEGAMQQLTHWYNGYCFDGTTQCFNPFPVLAALKAGRITQNEMDGASGVDWLGLTPARTLLKLHAEFSKPTSTASVSVSRLDIADLKQQNVRAVPLLLQTGLLTFSQGQSLTNTHLTVLPPNEYARQSILRMIATALRTPRVLESKTRLSDAICACNPAVFTIEAMAMLEAIPRTITKRNGVREAEFQAALFGAIIGSTPRDVAVVSAEHSTQRGRADVVVTFPGTDTVWIFEVGVGETDADTDVKLAQAKLYARAFSQAHVLCCAVMVAAKQPSASVIAKNSGNDGNPGASKRGRSGGQKNSGPAPAASNDDDADDAAGGASGASPFVFKFSWVQRIAGGVAGAETWEEVQLNVPETVTGLPGQPDDAV